MKRAKNFENNFDFSKAAELYEQLAEKRRDREAIRSLAKIRKLQRDFESSEEWFRSLDRLDGLTTNDYWDYSQVLAFNSKFDESKIILERYKQKSNLGILPNEKIQNFEKSLELGKTLLNRPTRFMAFPLVDLNSEFSDFGLVEVSDFQYFTSDRNIISTSQTAFNSKNAFKNTFNSWSGRGFTKIYQRELNKQEISASIFEPIDYEYHVGPIMFADEFVFYAKTQKPDILDKFTLKKVDVSVFPGLYYREITNDGLSDDEVIFPFNNHLEYIFTDPFYDPQTKTLYFASNFENKDGGLNLYSSHRLNDSWSLPQLISSSIVSLGNERTPFLDRNGDFYFSSDGLPGLGGLDIFIIKNFKQGNRTPENLGPPFNSNRDDFYFQKNSKNESFLTSDREGGKGFDDLYQIKINQEATVLLVGVVKDKDSKLPIQNAILSAKNRTNNSTVRYSSEIDGTFKFVLPAFVKYDLLANASNFLSQEFRELIDGTEIEKGKDSVYVEILLDRMQVFKPIKIENIYYDFNKWELRDDAKIELEQLIHLMNSHPSIKIELHSHTDSRGSNKYNQRLSDKRAKAVVDFLISNGISSNRLKPVGFGESKILNGCFDGKDCSEEDHQKNRRTEFMIIEM